MTRNQHIAIWVACSGTLAAVGVWVIGLFYPPLFVVSFAPAFLVVPAILLVPLYLAIRQLMRPVAEPVVPWQRAALAPVLAGLAVGCLAGLVYLAFTFAECVDLNCLLPAFATFIIGFPALALGSGAVLRRFCTPRPWLTGIVGAIAAGNVYFCFMELAGSGVVTLVVLFVAAGVIGYAWAALVTGVLLPPVARLVVFAVMLAVVPVTQAAGSLQDDREQVARLESITVPLMAPGDIPGFRPVRAYGNASRNTFYLDLEPTSSEARFRLILVRGMSRPAQFMPPDSCGRDGVLFGPVPIPCTYVAQDVWRHSSGSWINYYRTAGDWLYIISGEQELDALLAQTATSLHPVSARDLANDTT